MSRNEYRLALEAAGAEVLSFSSFGSYQGDWWALVEYNGVKGYVTGSYGSCSGCDAFSADFGSLYHWTEGDYNGNMHDVFNNSFENCNQCNVIIERLKEFGKSYLNLLSKKEAIAKASLDLEWDMEAQRMIDWIKAQ